MNELLEQHLTAHRGRLVRIAKQYAAGDEWQDLMQEMLIKIWSGYDSFNGRSRLDTWVYRVALNTALDHVRKHRLDTVPLEHIDAPSAAADDPLVFLDQFLRSLDPVNRGVLLMDLEGLSREDIATVLGISPGAVAVRMTRMKSRFAEQIVEGSS